MSTAALELLISLKDEASAGLSAIGGGLTSMAGLAAAGGLALGAAVVGVGAAAFNMAADVNQAANDMQAALGLTADEAAAMASQAEDIWANNWGNSIDDVSASLTTVTQMLGQVGNVSQEAIGQATADALALRDTFGIDVAESADAATTLMQQFGLTSKEAYDFIAAGAQQGLNRSGDLLDTIGEYSTQFAAGGADAGQFFSLLKSGLQGGVLGTDKAADAFKEFRVRIQDGSTATSAGLQQLGIDSNQLMRQMASGQITAADAWQLVIGKLNDTDDANVRMQAGVALLGTQFEDLGTAGALALDMTNTSMADLEGATASLSAKYQNWGSLWEGFKRQALDAILPLGQSLLNLANAAMPAITAAIPPIVAGISMIAGLLTSGLEAGILLFVQAWQGLQPTIGLLYNASAAIAAFVAGTGDLGTVADFLIDLFGVTLGGGVADFIGMITDAGNAIFNFVSGATGFVGLASSLMEIFGPTIGGLIAQAVSVLNDYATVWIDLGTTIYNVVSALMGGDLAGAWAALTGGIAQVAADYQTYAANLAALLWSLATTIGQAVLTWGAALVDWIAPYIPIALGYLQTFAAQIWAWVVAQAPILYQQVLTWGAAFVDWITPYIGMALAMLGTFAASIWAWIGAQAPGFVAQLAAWGAAFVDWITPYVSQALGALAGFGSAILSWIGSQASALGAQIATWGMALVEWIPGATVNFLAAWPGMLNSFLDWIGNAAGPLLAKLATWAAQFVAWIVPMIPGFIMALGGVAAAIVMFVAETAGVIAAKIVIWATSMLGWVAKNVLPALPGMLGSILSSIVSWILGPANTSILNSALSIGKSLVDGIRSGISKAWSGLMSWISAQVAKIPEPIRAALKIGSPSRVMAELVGLPIAQGIALGFSQGMPKVTTNLVNGVAGLMEKVASAVENGSKALAAVSGFQGASGSGLSGFLAAIKDMAIQFNDAAVELGGRILGTATRFADTIGKVTAPIDGALKALGGLVDFVAPARANISAFIASMYVLLNALNNMAAMFEAKAIKAAAVFAEGAAKMLAVVSPAIDALKKLPDLVSPTWQQVNAFGEALYRIVTELLNVAALFEARSLQAGAAFGEAGAKLLGVVGPAIEALKKLPDLVVPADGALAAFGDALTRTVQMLIQVAALFAQDAIDAAAKFAEGAGKTIAIVGSGVDGFTKLADFAGVPQAAIDAFGVALAATLVRLIAVAQTFTTEAIAAAAVFGEGAGKALAMIGATVDGFVKLADFAGVGDAAIAAFGAAITATVARLVQVAAGFEQSTIDAAAVFGAGVGKALSGIGAAVDSLGKLIDFKAPAEKAIQAFFLAVGGIMERMDSWSTFYNERMFASTAALSEGIKGAVANLGGIADSLGKLVDFQAPADASVKAFFLAIGGIMERLDSWSVTINTRMIETATAFTGGIAVVITQLRNALEAFATLGDAKNLGSSVLTTFMGSLTTLVNQMAAYLPPNAEVIGSNTIVGLINGIYSQRSNLIAAMTNTVLAAVQAAQATLGIASPSKVFEQIGQYTGQGMAGGMRTMQPAVASAGAGLGMAAVGGAAGGVGGSSRSAGASGPVNITFAAGAIAINGVQGGLNEKHLKTLAGYIKEDIAGEMRGRS